MLGTFADPSSVSNFEQMAARAVGQHRALLEKQLHLRAPLATETFEAQRRRLLEAAVVNATDAIIITEALQQDDPGPRIVYANAAFEQMTGYDAASVIGRSPRFLQGAGTTLESRCAMRTALDRWQRIEIDVVNYRRDGTPFVVALSIFPAENEDGWYDYWIAIQREVTERREVERLMDQVDTTRRQNYALAKEIGDRRRAEGRLEQVAYRDGLTGLFNRAYFRDRLTDALRHVHAEHASSFAVLFFDLDRFKIVNDSLGHRFGDTLLVEMAKRIRTCVRGTDVTARIGGDEFAVLIDNIESVRTAVDFAERIIAALREPVALEEISVSVQVSVGIAYRSVDGASAESVLRDADIAMYRAKRAGGDRYAVFDDDMHAEALRVFRLHADLRQALEDDAFVLHFQPIVELATGALLGFEGLVRWQHPQRGLVPPCDFIPVAEETGFIVKIGTCVLRKACYAMKRWLAMFPQAAAMRVSVNVSPLQLQDVAFPDTVRAALEEFGIGGSSLELEITENVFLDSPERASALLDRLHDLGVTIAVDDFGTGYSSLGYLERYRFDVLKVDRSFVARMDDGSKNAGLVRAIVGIGNVLGLTVLAEGVEEERQRVALIEAGCARAQGYLFGKPLPFDDACAFIASCP